MNNQREYYTLGIWYVKPGKENEFVDTWASFAHWSSESYAGSGIPHLLRDENEPLRFISFGPWDSVSTIQKWRESREFKSFAEQIKELCSDFQPNILKAVQF